MTIRTKIIREIIDDIDELVEVRRSQEKYAEAVGMRDIQLMLLEDITPK